MSLQDTSFAEVIGGVFVTLTAVAIGLQKAIKGWKSDSAETGIITMMHAELERMSAQNTRLAEELNRLQLELIKLNSELQKLTVENQRLHSEVVELNSEIARLKSMIDRRKDNHYEHSSS